MKREGGPKHEKRCGERRVLRCHCTSRVYSFEGFRRLGLVGWSRHKHYDWSEIRLLRIPTLWVLWISIRIRIPAIRLLSAVWLLRRILWLSSVLAWPLAAPLPPLALTEAGLQGDPSIAPDRPTDPQANAGSKANPTATAGPAPKAGAVLSLATSSISSDMPTNVLGNFGWVFGLFYEVMQAASAGAAGSGG